MSDLLNEAGVYFLREDVVSGEARGIIHSLDIGENFWPRIHSMKVSIAAVNLFPFDHEGPKPPYQLTAVAIKPVKRNLGDVRVEADEIGATYFGHTTSIDIGNVGKLVQEIATLHTEFYISDRMEDLRRIKEEIVPQSVLRDYDPDTEIGAKRIENGIVRRLYGVDVPQEWIKGLKKINPMLDVNLLPQGTGITLSEQGLRMIMAYERRVNELLILPKDK